MPLPSVFRADGKTVKNAAGQIVKQGFASERDAKFYARTENMKIEAERRLASSQEDRLTNAILSKFDTIEGKARDEGIEILVSRIAAARKAFANVPKS